MGGERESLKEENDLKRKKKLPPRTHFDAEQRGGLEVRANKNRPTNVQNEGTSRNSRKGRGSGLAEKPPWETGENTKGGKREKISIRFGTKGERGLQIRIDSWRLPFEGKGDLKPTYASLNSTPNPGEEKKGMIPRFGERLRRVRNKKRSPWPSSPKGGKGEVQYRAKSMGSIKKGSTHKGGKGTWMKKRGKTLVTFKREKKSRPLQGTKRKDPPQRILHTTTEA